MVHNCLTWDCCPNIFAGGENFHGPYEYVALESMEKSCKVIDIAKAKSK